MSGKLIVIEGLDGSGKATQAQLLAQSLSAQGLRVREISFPNYASGSSWMARSYLDGAFGRDPNDVNAYAASTFFSVDRFAGFRQDWGVFYADGGVLVADRYTTSNAVHQCAKLPRTEWDAFLTWLFDFEYRLLGIPAPDKVIYLQTDPAVSQRLMSERYHGDEAKKDIHERDIAYQARALAAAEYCARTLGWHSVCCTSGGVMRTIDDIHREVCALSGLV